VGEFAAEKDSYLAQDRPQAVSLQANWAVTFNERLTAFRGAFRLLPAITAWSRMNAPLVAKYARILRNRKLQRCYG
jgi:hypothetical protein